MRIFPKCTYLAVTVTSGSLLGVIPWQFVFAENKFLQKLYRFYANLMLGYYAVFLTSAYIKLLLILTATDDGSKLDEISANVPVTCINSITFAKQFIIKFSASFNGILRQIIDSENEVIAMDDREVSAIYETNSKEMKAKSKWYLVFLTICSVQYSLVPVLMGLEANNNDNNGTITEKPLPISVWFPWDEQKYYLIAYIRQIIDGAIVISFVAYTDVLMFSLIVFPVGQLRILNFMLEDFDSYKRKYADLHQMAPDADSVAYNAFVDMILRHEQIIVYVKRFNDTMSSLMVLQFLQCSIEIAFICLQAVANEITPVRLFFVSTLFLALIVRLFLYYYYANEIIILSKNLSISVWKSDWYDQPESVKFLMQIFMMRAQKPLSYTIGPFSYMSLDSIIAILKATYSYVMLVYRVN